MTDYQEQVRFYVENRTRTQTESYFKKYWLSRNEYLSKWRPIEQTIYAISGPKFPDIRFRGEFDILVLRGGRVFAEEDFYLLQACMRQTNDHEFVVVEHVDEDSPPHGEPPLRFKFPTGITWDELMSGGYVSQAVFEWPVKEFLVFGDTGSWGKIAANDYIFPVDLIGYQRKFASVFNEQFEPLLEREVLNWLPQDYLDVKRNETLYLN